MLSSKILPLKFLIMYCACAVHGLAQPSLILSILLRCCVTMALYRYLVASYPILMVLSRESAECVRKQGVYSEWAKGTMLLQALSRMVGRNRQAGSRALARRSLVPRPHPSAEVPWGLRSGNECG